MEHTLKNPHILIYKYFYTEIGMGKHMIIYINTAS